LFFVLFSYHDFGAGAPANGCWGAFFRMPKPGRRRGQKERLLHCTAFRAAGAHWRELLAVRVRFFNDAFRRQDSGRTGRFYSRRKPLPNAHLNGDVITRPCLQFCFAFLGEGLT
jgi:hypothetical protein